MTLRRIGRGKGFHQGTKPGEAGGKRQKGRDYPSRGQTRKPGVLKTQESCNPMQVCAGGSRTEVGGRSRVIVDTETSIKQGANTLSKFTKECCTKTNCIVESTIWWRGSTEYKAEEADDDYGQLPTPAHLIPQTNRKPPLKQLAPSVC